jgi:hypothetical protein
MTPTHITIHLLRPSDVFDIFTLMHMPNLLWRISILLSMVVFQVTDCAANAAMR